jgi:hypothetical protein
MTTLAIAVGVVIAVCQAPTASKRNNRSPILVQFEFILVIKINPKLVRK